MIELDRIYNMDCLDGMKMIPDGSIDLIVTDPPYRVTQRGNPKSSTMSGYWVKRKTCSGRIFDCNDTDIEKYLPEFFRILKADAHCYIMCNNFNLPHFFSEISKSGLKFVKLLVWDKQSKICGRYYMGQVEHIFMLRKGKDKPINNCGTSDILTFSNFNRERDGNGDLLHESIKPVPLMQCLIENSSNEGEIVLDPFMGSGTTAIACIRSNRHYVGYELDKVYYERASKRINNEMMQLTLF